MKYEILIVSGSMAARYVVEGDFQREAETKAMTHAKSRLPKLRALEIVQTIELKHRDPPLNPEPKFMRTRFLRDGR